MPFFQNVGRFIAGKLHQAGGVVKKVGHVAGVVARKVGHIAMAGAKIASGVAAVAGHPEISALAAGASHVLGRISDFSHGARNVATGIGQAGQALRMGNG